MVWQAIRAQWGRPLDLPQEELLKETASTVQTLLLALNDAFVHMEKFMPGRGVHAEAY